jgi:hypothetical protein
VLENTVRHQLMLQYTPDTVWWAPMPERAVGGWPDGLVVTSIRIDTVQHNISALLGMERLLRER